jgi:MtrB/PioB family decaheme-associated outer membrane protein
MQNFTVKINLRTLALAVQAALVALYAIPVHADDAADEAAEVAVLVVPTNTVEIGGAYTFRPSQKFGEYNGMNKESAYGIGNFSYRSGDAYGLGNGNGIRRYELTGNDLGTTMRSFGGSVSDQGKWSFGFNYDELQHNTGGGYQTPYSGTMGGNVFTLPGFGAAANTRTLTPAQLGQFHSLDVNNNRDNTSAFGTMVLDSHWDLRVDFNHLDQSGAKLQSFATAPIGGATGQKVALLPMPTNSRTETVNVALNWAGEKAYATIAYYGSFYRDNYNGFHFATFANAVSTMQTFGTPPDNNFHQINFTGGYALSNKTKLAGGLSYSYNTQSADYVYDTPAMNSPAPTSSLNGAVANIHADAKLTNQTTKDLTLSAGLKFDDRENRTASNIYNFVSVGGSTGNYPNTPLSIRKTQGELAGDYRLDSKQKIRMALNYDQIDRYCNSFAVGGGTPAYAPGTNCVTATETRSGKFSGSYRLKATDELDLNAAYAFDARRTSFDENARASIISTNGTFPLPATAGTGLNAGDYRGFNPYFDASRNQNMLKTGANWQATPKLSFSGNARYTDDKYLNMYGVQRGHSWGVDLDSSYIYRNQGTITVYFTQQERTRDLTDIQRSPFQGPSATVPSGGTFSNNMRDRDSTLGFNIKQAGLMGGKLDLAGDLAVSLGRTDYYTILNYTLLNGTVCSSPTIGSCGSPPTIRNQLIQLKLTGNYKLEKTTKLSLGYMYRNLHSDDFYYNALQYGATPTGVLPDNQPAPSYTQNVVFASVVHNF